MPLYNTATGLNILTDLSNIISERFYNTSNWIDNIQDKVDLEIEFTSNYAEELISDLYDYTNNELVNTSNYTELLISD